MSDATGIPLPVIEPKRRSRLADFLFWPGLCLTLVVYALNMFGDALRDLLDPRLRGGEGSYGGVGKRKRGLLSRLLNPFA